MKAILVIDMPNDCYDCPCYYEDRNQCEATLRNVGNTDIVKPSWCPLKLLPHKMAVENRWFSKEHAEGWNDCLDEILGETE